MSRKYSDLRRIRNILPPEEAAPVQKARCVLEAFRHRLAPPGIRLGRDVEQGGMRAGRRRQFLAASTLRLCQAPNLVSVHEGDCPQEIGAVDALQHADLVQAALPTDLLSSFAAALST